MANYDIDYLMRVKDQLTPALKKAMAAKKALDKSFGKTLVLKVDTKQARAALKSLKSTRIKLKVDIDMTAARAKIANLVAQLQAIRVNPFGGSAGTGRMNLGVVKVQVVNANAILVRMAAGGSPPPGGGGGNPPPAPPSGRRGRVSRVGEGAGALGGGLFLMQGVNAALELDRAMSTLEKATNGTKKELASFQSRAIAMSGQTGASAASIVDMMTEASKAGTAVKDLNKQVMDSIKVSVAWDMSTEDVSDSLRNIRAGLFSSTKDFATQQKQVMGVAETISFLADQSASSERFLSAYLGRTSGVVTAFKQPIEAVLALGGAFEAIGAQEETAARATNTLGIAMAKITQNKGDMDFASNMLGVKPAEFKNMVKKDMISTMLQLVKATEKMDILDRQVKIKELFGGEFGDDLIRVSGALEVYQKNLQIANDKTKQAGSINQQFAIAMSHVNKSVDKAKQGLKTAIGIAVLPWLEALVTVGGKLLEVANKHPIILKFAAAVAITAVALGAVAIAVTFITGSMVLMVAVVAGVVLFFQQLWEHSGSLRESLSGLGDTLMSLAGGYEATGGSMLFFHNAMMGIGMVLSLVVQTIDQMIIGVKTLAIAMFQLANGDMTGAWQTVKDGWAESQKSYEKYAAAVSRDMAQSEKMRMDLEKANSARSVVGLPVSGVAGSGVLAPSGGAAGAGQAAANTAFQTAATAQTQAADLQRKAATDNAATATLSQQASQSMLRAANAFVLATSKPLTVTVATAGSNGTQGR